MNRRDGQIVSRQILVILLDPRTPHINSKYHAGRPPHHFTMENTKGRSYALETFQFKEEFETATLKIANPFQQYTLARLLKMGDPEPAQKEFFLPDLMEMEKKALTTHAMSDLVVVWSIPFYAQRKYWFKLFIGFNYALFAPLLNHWTLQGLPSPEFNEENIEIYRCLWGNLGLVPMHEVFSDIASPASRLKSKLSVTSFNQGRERNSSMVDAASDVSTSPSFTSLKSKLSMDDLKSGLRRLFRTSENTKRAVKAEGLTELRRQSKLSQEQLSELQRSTHFDKKELQQWYKGELTTALPLKSLLMVARLLEGLPIWYAHQR